MERWINKEAKIIDFIQKHITILYLIAITFIGGYIRFLLKPFISRDMIYHLQPWMHTIIENGGLAALKLDIGDYNPPYLTILALLSYLPLNVVSLIKIPSVAFDFFASISIAVFVWRYLGEKSKAVFLYSVLLLNPLAVLNSAYWGQCDVIYTSFLVLCVLCCMKEKYIAAFILCGISFGFKLQALFILPMLLVLYIQKKKISFLHFLLIPLMNFALCLPAIIAGRPIEDVIFIYFRQIETYKQMTMNYYNIWQYFPGPYEFFSQVAILFTLAVIGTGAYCVLKMKIILDEHKLLYFSIWVIFSCCMFLPQMHERYGYAMEILLIIYASLYKRRIGLCLTVCMITLASYSNFLSEFTPLPAAQMSIINLACYLKFSYDGLRYLFSNSDNPVVIS